MISKPPTIKSFDDANKALQDFYNNLGLEDLRSVGVRTEAPTADQLNKGQQVIVEISGVPYKYYKTLAGTLYKIQMTLVS